MTQRKMNDKVKLFFAGDFCSKPSTSKITVSDELQDLLQSCDLRLVNFEVPLKPSVELPYQKRERFCQNGFENPFDSGNSGLFLRAYKVCRKTRGSFGQYSQQARAFDSEADDQRAG